MTPERGRPVTGADPDAPDRDRRTTITTQPACPRCHRPTADGALCTGERSCTERLERDLGDVPALAHAAAIGYSGQARVTRRDSGKREPDPDAGLPQTAKIQPLPYDEATSTAVRAAHATLVSWVRLVVEELRIPPKRTHGPACVLCTHLSCRASRVGGWPADRLPAMAGWLLGHVDWLRRHPAAVEVCDGIGQAVGQLRRAVDRAPELLYAGPCTSDLVPVEVDGELTIRECGSWSWAERRVVQTDLYAVLGAAVVTCPVCEAQYDVEDRRAWMLKASQDHLARASVIAHALTAMGREVTPKRVHKWAEQGRLFRVSADELGRPLYRVGDVSDLQLEDAQREAGRAATRGRRVG